MLLAGLTLLPALLAVVRPGGVLADARPRAGTRARPGVWGRVAGRIVPGLRCALTIGVVVFGALRGAVTATGRRVRRHDTAPAGTDSAAGSRC